MTKESLSDADIENNYRWFKFFTGIELIFFFSCRLHNGERINYESTTNAELKRLPVSTDRLDNGWYYI